MLGGGGLGVSVEGVDMEVVVLVEGVPVLREDRCFWGVVQEGCVQWNGLVCR